MDHRPRFNVLRSRWTTTLLCVGLLALGSGCVSWDPIFRGSVRVVSWLTHLV